MNSKQRRTNKRYWRYHAELDDETSLEEYIDIRRWCEAQFGKVGFRWGNTLHFLSFDFRNDKDYVLFVLKWT